MKTQRLLLLVLASMSVPGFGQVPTPSRPAESQAGTTSPGEGVAAPASPAQENARRVAILLHAFAKDNGGKLPARLSDLVPSYLPDSALIPEYVFKTSGAELAKLQPDAVVLQHKTDTKVQIKASQIQGIKETPSGGSSAAEKGE